MSNLFNVGAFNKTMWINQPKLVTERIGYEIEKNTLQDLKSIS